MSESSNLLEPGSRVSSLIDNLHDVIDQVPHAIIVIDGDGKIAFFSKGAERMFGYAEAEVIGENVSMLMPSPDREAHDSYIARYLETGEKRIIGIGRVTTARARDGGIFPIDLSVSEMTIDGRKLFSGVIKDLTEQRETESQMHMLQAELAHVSRISSLGTFASSLAHELNQPLTSVANYAEAAIGLLDDPTQADLEDVRHALRECAAESIRAGKIVQRLRQFIMRGETEPEIVSVSRLVEEAKALALVNGDGRDVEFVVRLDPGCDKILAVPVQLQQVLVNLLRNALEAMEHSETKQIVIASEPAKQGKVLISVSDSGPGLDKHVAERLFHPFVSTKASGMGLGLSICHTIVTAHGGKITAGPSDMGGTTFSFTLTSAEPEKQDV